MLIVAQLWKQNGDRLENKNGVWMYMEETWILPNENKKNEIFSCLHQKMDPSIMNIIVDSEFKGLTQKCIDGIEDCFGKRCITKSFDCITAKEWLDVLITSFVRIVKLEIEYFAILRYNGV